MQTPMQAFAPTDSRHPEAGGITILVVFMLLILMTVTAIGMSRNALKEIIIVGTERQGVEARNVADSGLEWSIFWLDEGNRNKVSPDAGATILTADIKELTSSDENAGVSKSVAATASSPMVATDTGVTKSYNVTIATMGKIEMPMVVQGPGIVILSPLLWSVRSNATVDYGALKFQHSRESWVLAPPPGTAGNK